ncbi:MAG: hypothetical protein KZQ88_09020 [Candidatus Thiodiazotropha sp. (ex Dulcina madagascariensis)]|nr:hypothetical protein [Candidatus Thiodiazotropha sp. (ex Dulcina madagascariensis)]MCU7929077.1 hypothetical protein [Candidatus Thiodiazotropha sp. (ex Dulcina madagascariensis)]
MNRTWDDDQITTFVRQTLGCNCPDEVFERVLVSNQEISEFAGPVTRIDIGGRLLVYLMPIASIGVEAAAVERAVVAGRTDRDSRGFNRFRLVVADSSDAGQQRRVMQMFSRVAGRDEKLHLHFVQPGLLEGIAPKAPN